MEKIALITGASKGIGREFANVFAKNGYSLLLIARTTSELEKLQSELKSKYQCESKILSLDLSQPQCVDTIMTAFQEEIPKIEVLVNNAGFGFAKKFTDIAEQDIDGMLAVNINVLTKLTYRVLPFMTAKKSGKILNVASTAAFAPGPYMAVYYATKAYVLSFSEALYEEYAEDGVTISALCPGVTKTSFQARAGMEKTVIMSGLLPMMSAEEVANIGYDGLMKGKRVIITGVMNKITVFFMQFMPSFITAKMTAILDKPK